MMKTKALIVTGENSISSGEVEILQPESHEVLVQTKYSVISPGTELRCLKNTGNSVGKHPYVPGYSSSGVIVETGSDVTDLEVGDEVFYTGTDHCNIHVQWGGHIAHAVKSASHSIKIPSSVSLLDAAIAKLAAISHRGTRMIDDPTGKKIAVVGLGPIGQLSARIFRAKGADVCGVDISQCRVETLNKSGVKALCCDRSVSAALQADGFGQCDVLVDATGAPQLIEDLISGLKDKPWDESQVSGGTYIIQGSYSDGLEIPYQKAFMKEVSFLLPRDNQRRDIESTLKLMADGKLDVSDLISGVYDIEESASVYAQLAELNNPLLTGAFKW